MVRLVSGSNCPSSGTETMISFRDGFADFFKFF